MLESVLSCHKVHPVVLLVSIKRNLLFIREVSLIVYWASELMYSKLHTKHANYGPEHDRHVVHRQVWFSESQVIGYIADGAHESGITSHWINRKGTTINRSLSAIESGEVSMPTLFSLPRNFLDTPLPTSASMPRFDEITAHSKKVLPVRY
jgi:hypothetical protein